MFRKISQATPLNTETSTNRPVNLRIDVPLLIIIAVLLVFGMIMVYSASYDPSYRFHGDPFLIVRRQFLFLLLGLAVAAVATFFDYHIYRRLAVPMMVVTIILLIAVLFISQANNVVQRTLFGNSVQPSELAKLAMVIYLSVWLYAKRDQIHQVSFGLIPMAVMLGVLGGLVAVQPDLSAVVTILFLGGLMFFLAGGDLKQIAILAVVSIVAGLLVYQISATASDRIGGFLAGISDPFRAPDQVQRSLGAFIQGGVFGVGIGKGEVKLTGLQVPHTDSIFAVVGEETGIIGATILLVLFSLLLWRGLKVARRAPDELGALLAAGVTLWIVFEAFVNMASVVNLVPYAGNALPLISVGGSNLVMTLAGVGILLNISRLSVQTREESGRFFGALVDLRRRNGRRSVPRPDRPASVNRDV